MDYGEKHVDIQLFRGTIHWYNDYKDETQISTVLGFASTISDFIRRIETDFCDISAIEVASVNLGDCSSQLLYIPASLVENGTLKIIEDENDY